MIKYLNINIFKIRAGSKLPNTDEKREEDLSIWPYMVFMDWNTLYT